MDKIDTNGSIEKKELSRLAKLRQLLSRRDKLHFLGLLGLMLIASFFEMVGVGAVPAFVAALAVPDRVMAFPVVGDLLRSLHITTPHRLVIWGAVGLMAVYVLKTAYLVFVYYAVARTSEVYRVRLADRLFSAYMTAPYEFHLGRNSAELQRNVNFETKELLTGVIRPILSGIMASMMTTFIVILLVIATPSVAFVGVTLVGGGSWLFMRVFNKRLGAYGSEAQGERKESIKILNQALGAYVDVQVLGREQFFIESFRKAIAQFARANRFKELVSKTAPHVLELIAIAGMLLVVLGMVVYDSVDVGTVIPVLALFGAAVVRLKSTISTIVTASSQLRFSMVSIDPVYADFMALKLEAEHTRKRKARAKKEAVGRIGLNREIRIRDLQYIYPDASSPALEGIDMTIPKGTSVGFVGATGSGKTTLINVMLGLLRPEKGSILVDGVDIFSDLRAWQNTIGYVPQTIYLLDDSIKRNIAFGLPDEEIDNDQLWDAIRAAQLDEFVFNLQDGIETAVGERGARLSGGQRQRIGLARALYKKPDILVMDEATSALDNHTENLVMEAIENLKGDLTLVMIAHRLSTVRSCEQLFLLGNGCVEAYGTYQELRKNHEKFRVLTEFE